MVALRKLTGWLWQMTSSIYTNELWQKQPKQQNNNNWVYEQEYTAYCTRKVVLTSKHWEAGTLSEEHQVWKRPLRSFHSTVT